MGGDRLEADETDEATTYGLATAAILRLIGAAAVLVAVAVFVLTLAVAFTDGPPGVVLVGGVAGLVGLAGAAWWLRRSWVVRLTGQGYAVRLVRGVGVAEAKWAAVAEAVAVTRRGVRCIELSLGSAGLTTIPVGLLAGDNAAFVQDLQVRLQTARGLKPLT